MGGGLSCIPNCDYYAMEAIMLVYVHALKHRVQHIYISYKFHCNLCGGTD